ncbi:MAG: methylmalonyl-CoA epimerase [Candidatus Thalassarchaeaceae archaeon]|nr:methylmalonyl-CoA epimerase [Candidatus Thalassarchaeaceae archaeon]
MKIRLDHIGIAVNDLESSGKFWRLLGLLQSEEDEVNLEQGVNIRFFSATASGNPVRIELLESLGEDTPVGRFLTKRGQGVQQIAFEVDDLDSLIVELLANNVVFTQPEPSIGAGGSRVTFVHPKSTGGVLVELLEFRKE